MSRFDDTTLGAYVDGELPLSAAAAIARAEASDPALRARIEALRALGAAARNSFATIEREALPAALAHRLDQVTAARTGTGENRSARWLASLLGRPLVRRLAGACAAILLALGAGAYASGLLQVGTTPSDETYEDGWIEQVKRSYDIYADIFRREARPMVDVDGLDGGAELGAWFGPKLNRTLAVPDLSPHGLTLMGGRLVIVAGQPSAQFLYVTADGFPFALSVVPSAGSDQRVSARQHESVTLLHWRAKNYGYALIGNLAPDAMRSLADEIAPQLSPGA
jgi:anti-sigma factor RsiW